MYGDFNRIIVQLVQHPVMHKPLSDLTYTECELAYALIRELIDLSTEGDYTLLDYIQMAVNAVTNFVQKLCAGKT